ncbi:CDIF630_02480 family spore surface protein [Tepidibacter aestuarii]|uniref:CDIF630_02480 family spore surface protein n=1 Tax=Tepidibacter aestuarii TaxID=2925782 RepID=UPI0020C11981|nr:DUF3787 domain-containing protein [Tepidibacter aestuarii]
MKNKDKRNKFTNLAESHETAAWADIESVFDETNVSIPSQRATEEAKEWVDDENQK